MGISPNTIVPLNEIGQPTFVEIIMITNVIDRTSISQDGINCRQICDQVYDFKIQRDLFDPATVVQVRDLLYKKSRTDLDNFRVFLRDFRTQKLTEITMTTAVNTKDSVVFIEKSVLVSKNPYLDSCTADSGPLNRVKTRLAGGNEILPTRFLWP